MASISNTADAIVIGAGAAGLMAAYELAARGASVALLEARERVGGRVWSEWCEGWPRAVELGAEFIHGGNETFSNLVRAAHLEPEPVPEHMWWMEAGEREGIADAWERIYAVFHRIGPNFRGSFGAWLSKHAGELSEQDRKLAFTFVEGFHGGAVDRVSAQTLHASSHEGSEEQSRPGGAYERVLNAIREKPGQGTVTLYLGTPVSAVRWERGGVTVKSRQGELWKARVAVVTLPLGVLKAAPDQAGAVQFDPPLSEKRDACSRVEVGHTFRMVLRLRDDAWKQTILPAALRKDSGRGFGFLQSDAEAFPVWWAAAPDPILVGWTGGPKALALAALSNEQLFRRAIATLGTLLDRSPASLTSLVVDWGCHNWTADSFTRGAYSFSQAGCEDVPAVLAAPVEDTLFFAGEATADPLELGTVHGAIASGLRAARDAWSVLQPEPGKPDDSLTASKS